MLSKNIKSKLQTTLLLGAAFIALPNVVLAAEGDVGTLEGAEVNRVKAYDWGAVDVGTDKVVCNGDKHGHFKNDDVGHDNMMKVALAASLSGRKVDIGWMITASGACHIEWIFMK